MVPHVDRDTPLAERQQWPQEKPPRTESVSPFLYPFCAQWTGMVRASCPYCGWIGFYRFWYGQWKYQCDSCRRWLVIGLIASPIAAHRHGASGGVETPLDMIFPSHDLNPRPWRMGEPVHRVRTLTARQLAARGARYAIAARKGMRRKKDDNTRASDASVPASRKRTAPRKRTSPPDNSPHE